MTASPDPCERQVVAAGCHVDPSGHDELAVGGLDDRDRGDAVESLGQRLGEQGGHVLDDEDRDAEVGGQGRHDLGERAGPAGRHRDDDGGDGAAPRREPPVPAALVPFDPTGVW